MLREVNEPLWKNDLKPKKNVSITTLGVHSYDGRIQYIASKHCGSVDSERNV